LSEIRNVRPAKKDRIYLGQKKVVETRKTGKRMQRPFLAETGRQKMEWWTLDGQTRLYILSQHQLSNPHFTGAVETLNVGQ
jgi:hypothetical protein